MHLDHVPRVVHPADPLIRVQGKVGRVIVLSEEHHPLTPVGIEVVVALAVLVPHEVLTSRVLLIQLVDDMRGDVHMAARTATPIALHLAGCPRGSHPHLCRVRIPIASPRDVASRTVVNLQAPQPPALKIHAAPIVHVDHAVSPLRRLDSVKVVEEVEHGAAYHEANGGVRVDVVPAEQFHAIGVHLRDHIDVVGPKAAGTTRVFPFSRPSNMARTNTTLSLTYTPFFFDPLLIMSFRLSATHVGPHGPPLAVRAARRNVTNAHLRGSIPAGEFCEGITTELKTVVDAMLFEATP